MQKFQNDFFSYEETCSKIKRLGIVPEENPSPDMMRKLQKIVDKCLSRYVPLPDDYMLKGVYLYREEEQAGELRKTFGYTIEAGDGIAIIGLSYGLLEYDMPVFHDIVFLHELAHLTEWEHNEVFQNRFNELEFDYFFYNKVRLDSRAQPKPNRSGWKM